MSGIERAIELLKNQTLDSVDGFDRGETSVVISQLETETDGHLDTTTREFVKEAGKMLVENDYFTSETANALAKKYGHEELQGSLKTWNTDWLEKFGSWISGSVAEKWYDNDERITLINTAVKMAQNEYHPELCDELVPLLTNDADYDVRSAAANALASLSSSDGSYYGMSKLDEVLTKTDLRTQQTISYVLATNPLGIKQLPAQNNIAKLAADSHTPPTTRMNLCKALSEFETYDEVVAKSIVSTLDFCSTDKRVPQDEETRCQLASAQILKETGSRMQDLPSAKDLCNSMAKLALSTDQDVAVAAFGALAEMGDVAFDRIKSLLANGDSQTKALALAALNDYGRSLYYYLSDADVDTHDPKYSQKIARYGSIRDTLLSYTTPATNSSLVRVSAAENLSDFDRATAGKSTSRESIATVCDVLSQNNLSSQTTIDALKLATALYDGTGATKPLVEGIIKTLSNSSANVQNEAIKALGRCENSTRAVTTLKSVMLNHKDQAVVRLATMSIVKLTNISDQDQIVINSKAAVHSMVEGSKNGTLPCLDGLGSDEKKEFLAFAAGQLELMRS